MSGYCINPTQHCSTTYYFTVLQYMNINFLICKSYEWLGIIFNINFKFIIQGPKLAVKIFFRFGT